MLKIIIFKIIINLNQHILDVLYSLNYTSYPIKNFFRLSKEYHHDINSVLIINILH